MLYGYLMACNAADIPALKFPRNEIIEIIPASYNNEANRIHIPDLPPNIIPDSPEDIRIPVPPSGICTPFSGIGSPAGTASPSDKNRLSRGFITPEEPGQGTSLMIERALRGN